VTRGGLPARIWEEMMSNDKYDVVIIGGAMLESA